MKSIGKKLLGLTLILGAGLAGCDSSSTEPQLGSPTNVEVRALSPTSVRVTWDPVPGAASYDVESAVGATGSFSPLGPSTEPSRDVGGLITGEQYRFRVTAVSGSRRGAVSSPSAPIIVPNEIFSIVDGDITSNRTFYKDSTYVLSGFIKVANSATLTIEPGTKIVGDYEIPGSSLFILRGAKIVAEGTVDEPIVFTSERPVGERQPGDWGGVIMIGNGVINRTGPTSIEGTGTPPDLNPTQFYHGGTDNNDNSGVLRYVRIEFAGYPTAPNEELNSLTMAAVGAGTRIEYVQVVQGLDDSFEWFGGAVNGRYLISYESADDHFDASEGYIGRNQFLIAFQSIRPDPRSGLQGGVASDPQGIENDGCWATNCAAGSDDALRGHSQPYTVPVFANFTLVGPPHGAWETTGGNYGMMLRRGTGGLYVNGVVTRYSRAAISFRGQSTWSRHEEGNLAVRNLYVSSTCLLGGAPCSPSSAFQNENTSATSPESRQFVLDHAANAIEVGTVATENLFAALPANTTAATATSFDWRPAAGSPIASGGLTDFSVLPQQLWAATQGNGSPNSEIVPTNYRGAADPNGPAWWSGWTSYARN
jgi:hypothetical protein